MDVFTFGVLGIVVLGIVIVGACLAVVYNVLGLAAKPAYGIPWIPPEQEELPDLENMMGGESDAASDPTYADEGSSSYATEIDDPMADFRPAPEAEADAPEPEFDVPDLGRPIQMQLGAVKRFYDADAALFVDSRDRLDYEIGHIPGSVNMPYEEVIADPVALESVDSGGRPIIAYCSGGTCETSLGLAYALFDHGHSKVLVFLGGYPEWEQAGYPIEEGAGPESGVR